MQQYDTTLEHNAKWIHFIKHILIMPSELKITSLKTY